MKKLGIQLAFGVIKINVKTVTSVLRGLEDRGISE